MQTGEGRGVTEHFKRQDDEERQCDALMQRVAGGDRRALEELFRREAGRLIAIARRILRRPELAEEATQDTFVIAWQKAKLFDAGRGAARAWLTTIVRNRALNMLRDAGRMELHDGDTLAALGDRAAMGTRNFEALPEGNALRRCLELLPEERRRSILLAYAGGFTHGEIAASTGAPVGTVKAWIRRGTIALQECLQ